MGVKSQKKSFHGVEVTVRKFTGAEALRVSHDANQEIGWHNHDWACLTIPLIGACREVFDGGEVFLEGPSAVLHPPGSYHGDEVGAEGLETFSIQFDPAWLEAGLRLKLDRSSALVGGRVALAANHLIGIWRNVASQEKKLKQATCEFLHKIRLEPPPRLPAWLGQAQEDLRRSPAITTDQLARKLNLHPAWFARSYRLAVGEGLADTRRRHRLVSALGLLRNSDQTLADVAAGAGFCDQSHMNRNFAAVLGKTPLQVRHDTSPGAS